ncbi:MAG TPA: hypothetical protein VF331_01210 [Polyangiales bacterium]
MDQKARRPDFDPFSDHFFSQPSLAPVEIDAHDWDHDEPALSPGSRKAMHATLAMLAVSLTAVGGFLFYSKVWMPTPVELGASGVVAPQPLALANSHFVSEHVAPSPNPSLPTPTLLTQAAAPSAWPAPAQQVAVPAALVAPTARAVAMARPALTATRSTQHFVAAAARPSVEDALLKQAYRSLNGGNPHEALARARRVLASAPSRADAWLVVGSAYAAMQDQKSALQAFRSCALRATGAYVSECRKLARE